jgi:phage protein U
MQWGGVSFEVMPVNVHEYDHDVGSDIVQKPVLGGRQPNEFVGISDETYRFKGRVFPIALGGMSQLQYLEEASKSGVPNVLMRGDGAFLGWFILQSFNRGSRHIYRNGIGQMEEFELNFIRDEPPSPTGFFVSLAGLIGGLMG